MLLHIHSDTHVDTHTHTLHTHSHPYIHTGTCAVTYSHMLINHKYRETKVKPFCSLFRERSGPQMEWSVVQEGRGEQ